MNEEKTVTAERKHHPYSPSKLQTKESCPHYESSFSDSEASRIGTIQHDMAESGIDNEKLPDYKALAVVECMKFVDERIALYPGCTVIKEQYLPIDNERVAAADGSLWDGTTAGYLDVGILSADGETCEVIDFKFGKVQVEPAKNNLQGMAYVLGLRKKFPTIKRALVWFVMPHRDEVSGCEFELDHFEKAYFRIRTVVQRSIEANSDKDPVTGWRTARPNIGACVFCDNLGKCPKVIDLALKIGKKYRPLQIPDSISTTVFTDPEQIEMGLRLSQVIKAWAEAYRTQATAKTIDDPNFTPKGYTIATMQKRTVKDAQALVKIAQEFIPEEDRAKAEALFDVPIGALEELIRTYAKRGMKDKTEEAFGKLALEKGAVALGRPFAFLRQSNEKSSQD